MQINRDEDGEEGGDDHLGSQWNFVRLNHAWFARRNRPGGGDGRASFRFHGRIFFGGPSGLGLGGLMGVSAARMAFCTAGLERFPK